MYRCPATGNVTRGIDRPRSVAEPFGTRCNGNAPRSCRGFAEWAFVPPGSLSRAHTEGKDTRWLVVRFRASVALSNVQNTFGVRMCHFSR
jgi:hypothetical protein